MKDVDIGDPSPAVFTRLEYDLWDRPNAAFVSSEGEAFCLERQEVELRIRYLEANGLETLQEHRALKALAAAGAA
jgi:hypothetical protein